jgi:hypothetical protein
MMLPAFVVAPGAPQQEPDDELGSHFFRGEQVLLLDVIPFLESVLLGTEARRSAASAHP